MDLRIGRPQFLHQEIGQLLPRIKQMERFTHDAVVRTNLAGAEAELVARAEPAPIVLDLIGSDVLADRPQLHLDDDPITKHVVMDRPVARFFRVGVVVARFDDRPVLPQAPTHRGDTIQRGQRRPDAADVVHLGQLHVLEAMQVLDDRVAFLEPLSNVDSPAYKAILRRSLRSPPTQALGASSTGAQASPPARFASPLVKLTPEASLSGSFGGAIEPSYEGPVKGSEIPLKVSPAPADQRDDITMG